MENCESNDFWRSWKTLYSSSKSHYASVVNGCSSKESIANEFKNSFHSNSQPNDEEKVQKLNHRFFAMHAEYERSHLDSCTCSNDNFSFQNVFVKDFDVIAGMKRGKCLDDFSLSAEHFQNGPLRLYQRVTSLFTNMLKHGFVPKQFRSGFMIPVIKDNQGNHSDVSNYRGITISPVISKIFEHVLKSVFLEHLSTPTHRYGFKKGSSTSHAIFCLQETVSYYIHKAGYTAIQSRMGGQERKRRKSKISPTYRCTDRHSKF